MTKKQSSFLNMCKAVVSVLTSVANAPLVAGIPALEQFKDDLIVLIQEMEAYAETQQAADDGVTEDKETKRLRLCRVASNMAGLLFSWATSTGNTIIAGQMKINYSDLTRMKESLLGDRCRFIHTVGTDNLVAATPYGVTAGRLTELMTCITQYEAKATAPRDAEVIISAATTGLDNKQKVTATLLDDQMDPLVNIFLDTEPDFYNQYYAARTIVDAPVQHTKAEGLVTKIETDETLAEVIVTATKIPDPETPEEEPVVFTTTTNAIGVYTLPITIPGYYNITYVLPTYVTHQVSNVQFKLGETVTLNVEMTPVP